LHCQLSIKAVVRRHRQRLALDEGYIAGERLRCLPDHENTAEKNAKSKE
jgi:hypothetical protein